MVAGISRKVSENNKNRKVEAVRRRRVPDQRLSAAKKKSQKKYRKLLLEGEGELGIRQWFLCPERTGEPVV